MIEGFGVCCDLKACIYELSVLVMPKGLVGRAGFRWLCVILYLLNSRNLLKKVFESFVPAKLLSRRYSLLDLSCNRGPVERRLRAFRCIGIERACLDLFYLINQLVRLSF